MVLNAKPWWELHIDAGRITVVLRSVLPGGGVWQIGDHTRLFSSGRVERAVEMGIYSSGPLQCFTCNNPIHDLKL